MKAESTCSRYRAELSARLDGDGDTTMTDELDAHLQECARCREFERTQHSLRRALRLAPVADVPDIADRVMARIAVDGDKTRKQFRVKVASVAAVAAALVVLASALPVLAPEVPVANASEVTRRAFSAARTLDSYRATFDIVERNWHPDIPVRRFEATVWYRAPERLRLTVRDLTDLPPGSWPTNDVDLIAGPRRSWIREPYSCPPQALPGCAVQAGVEERSVVGRHPFDGTSTAPSEIVVPLETLATSDAFSVAGTETIGGRDALHVVLTYRQAYPLIQALQVGGSWARLFPLDRVDLWLDPETSFPLRFTVSRPGLGAPVLEVDARVVQPDANPPDEIFVPPRRGNVRSAGFRDRAVRLPAGAMPSHLAGLGEYRSGTSGRSKIVTFVDGMSYLKLTTRRGPPQPAPLPGETLTLRPGSFGLYRPAEPHQPRLIEVAGPGLTVRLESNLRRNELIRIAASLPLDGLQPVSAGAETNVVALTEARLKQLEVARPTELPPGYGPFSAQMNQTKTGTEVAIVYFASESAWEGSEIRLFQSSGVGMLPPSSEDLAAVTVDGSRGRWSSERGELEWIDRAGIYHSVSAPSFDLASVIAIAESLR